MVPQLLSSSFSLLTAHPTTGCSTGFMVEQRGDWPELVRAASETAPAAIELSALSEDELPGLESFLRGAARMPFHFVSVHGPSKARRSSDATLAEQLAALPFWISAIVLHPDAMEDPRAYRHLGRRLAIENMDTRKATGQTAADLQSYFAELPEARLCFDIAHAADVDPTMRVAREILNQHAGRLSHVHVSSLDDQQHHVPLTPADEERFTPLLRRCGDVPWILEAPLR